MLFDFLCSDLKFSSTNHPQSNGYTEWGKALLEAYLRHNATTSKANWWSC